MAAPLRVAVLLSGSGRTLQNFIDKRAAGRLSIDIRLVISSKANVLGIERAKAANIPSEIISPKACPKIFEIIDRSGVDLVCLAGWMCFLEIPQRFENRVMNIHPALLPAFGGKGMYGHRVHEAVIDYGCKVSGCTVHFVDNEYDKGPIILQRVCEVREGDDADLLAARVFEEEKRAYPEAIRLFAEKRLRVEGRRVSVARATNP